MSQALYDPLDKDPKFANYTSFIEAGYVMFLEGSGARVVPILDTETDEETLNKLKHLDGVLFPGGSGDDYYKGKARYIWDRAIEFNDNGQFFPLWGTCLGFEYMGIFAADEGDDVLSSLTSENVSLKVKFEVDPTFTKMFDGAGEDAKIYEEKDFAVNMHTYGIAPEKFKTDEGLSKMFTMTSTSHDDQHDSTFAATIESPRYPFYATQFHPEK